MLTAIFTATALGGMGFAEGFCTATALWVRFVGAATTVVWAGGLSWVIFKIVGALVGLRVSDEDEIKGLDITTHGERGYESLSPAGRGRGKKERCHEDNYGHHQAAQAR